MSKSLFRITFSAVLATLIVFQGVSVSRAEEAPAEGSDRKLWSYEESYRKNVEDVCKKAWNPANGSVIQAKDLIYPKIGSKNADKQYREGVKSVGGDVSGIGEILSGISGDDPFSFGSDIALASETYKERMNGIFACAQINFKIRTHERLLRTIKGEKADNGNTAKRVEEQTKLLRQEMRKRKCADRTATEGKNNIMMKKDLLRQSTYEYCNYRHYLQYLKFNTQWRLSEFISAEQKRMEEKRAEAPSEGGGPQINAEEMVSKVGNAVGSIDREIAHTREVFPQSMVAYNEFERTYASHVVSLFVLEDYVLLRDSLKKIMNPLGQSIYKASNAQSVRSP